MSSDNIIHSEAGSEVVAGTVPDGQRGAKTVLIVCSRLFREALMLLLDRPGTTFANGIATVDEALALMEGGFVPDLTIAVLIGEEAADEAMKAIVRARRSFPGTRWLLLADSVSPRLLRQAVAAGVDGLLQHEITAHILRHASELLLLGQTLLPKGLAEYGERPREPDPAQSRGDPAIVIAVSTPEPEPGTQAAPTLHAVSALPVQLSERERQILGCLERGDSNKLIARELKIADATVKVHVKALLRKLRVINRTQAAVFAINNRERSARARDATEESDEPYGSGVVDGSSGVIRSANRNTRSVELRPFRPVPQLGKILGSPEPRTSREADCSDRTPTNAVI